MEELLPQDLRRRVEVRVPAQAVQLRRARVLVARALEHITVGDEPLLQELQAFLHAYAARELYSDDKGCAASVAGMRLQRRAVVLARGAALGGYVHFDALLLEMLSSLGLLECLSLGARGPGARGETTSSLGSSLRRVQGRAS